MLGDLLSKAAGHGTAAELEAMTAERDFFREKYTEQMLKMNAMEEVLRDNQRMICRLRDEILAAKQQQQQQHQQQKSEGLTTTGSSGNAVTDDEVSVRHGDSTYENDDDDGDDDKEQHSESSASNYSKIDDGGDSRNDNEAEEIRANAERMLQWAQYQSSKKSSPESLRRQMNSSCRKSDANVVLFSANSLVDLDMDQDRDTSVTKEGKMSKLSDNLRDMISPSASSDDDEECESDDERSCVSCDDK